MKKEKDDEDADEQSKKDNKGCLDNLDNWQGLPHSFRHFLCLLPGFINKQHLVA